MEESWIARYYEAVTFFYWEPQHLGRQKNAKVTLTAERMRTRIELMEVTLNHQLNQFFSLAPRSLRTRLFERVLGVTLFSTDFCMAGRECDKEYELRNAMQPDFPFVAQDLKQAVFMEMKIGAKTSIEQLLKYVLLALSVELKHKMEMKHSHVLLGKGTFSGLWKRQLASVDHLRPLLTEKEIDAFLVGKSASIRDNKARFCEIVSEMQIGFITYQDLSQCLEAEIEASDGCAGAEVYCNLVNGMIGELRRRKLAFVG